MQGKQYKDLNLRVAASSTTLLDLVVTNGICRKINSGIIRSDVSDHFPVFCAVTNKLTSKNQLASETFYRDMKQFWADDYRKDLFSLLTNFVSALPRITANNFNSIFDTFAKTVADAINRHALLKKAFRKQIRLNLTPWITKGIMISFKNKQKIYKTHFINSDTFQKQFYNTYANKLTKVNFKSKQLYFQDELFRNKSNQLKTWDVIKALIYTTSKKAKLPNT